MVECINIARHSAGVVEDGKMVPKQLLGNATKGMQGALVHEDGLDEVAITQPIEVGAPEITAVLTHAPAPGDGLKIFDCPLQVP